MSDIGDFIHRTWIILPKLHTYAKLMYSRGVQEVKKHFVNDLGANPDMK